MKRKPIIDIRHGVEIIMRSVGAPERCETGICDYGGECIVCNAANGEACLSRVKKIPGRFG